VKHISHHKQRKHFHLKRELGLFNATVAGVGIIVGAGIYVLIGAAAGLAGNAVWLSFLISAIVALFTGLSYAELSSIFPFDSGEYTYVEKASNQFFAFITAYLVLITGVVTAAAVALGFAGYMNGLLNLNSTFLIAFGVIIIFSIINFMGIKHSARMNLILTTLEVSGLVIIIVFGARFIGKVNYLSMPNGLPGILSAAALIFFAYGGFEAIVKLSEETKNPRKVIPRALMYSLLITTVLYILVGLVSVSVVGWETLSASEAPVALVAQSLMGSQAFFILGIVALLSTANTILIILVTNSRMLYGLGQRIPRLRFFSKIHEATATPHYAVMFTGVIALLFILLGRSIEFVANLSNFAIFITFFAVNLSVIALRYKKTRKRQFRVPLNIGKFPVIPLFGAVFCLFMIYNLPWLVIFHGSILIVIGIFLYGVICRKKKNKKYC